MAASAQSGWPEGLRRGGPSRWRGPPRIRTSANPEWCKSGSRGWPAGRSRRAMPAAAAATVSRVASVINCCTRRARLAPNAARSTSSGRRSATRANRRWATLAHAVSSTKTTTPNSTSEAVLTGPASWSRSEIRRILFALSADGSCWYWRRMSARYRDEACDRVIPGFRRPTPFHMMARAFEICPGSKTVGVQTMVAPG